MSKQITSVKGLFGQIIHYEDGRRVGESWPGLFEGSYDHYDADGRYAGYSDPGIVAELVHHDERGVYVGKTYTGLFGQKKHYSAEHGFAGETWDGTAEEVSELFDDGGFDEGFDDE